MVAFPHVLYTYPGAWPPLVDHYISTKQYVGIKNGGGCPVVEIGKQSATTALTMHNLRDSSTATHRLARLRETKAKTTRRDNNF